MSEPSIVLDPVSRPAAVEIVSGEVVEALFTRYETEISALRLELEEAIRVVRLEEERLNAHPAAAIIDDAFETEVLAQVGLSVYGVTPGSPITSEETRETEELPEWTGRRVELATEREPLERDQLPEWTGRRVEMAIERDPLENPRAGISQDAQVDRQARAEPVSDKPRTIVTRPRNASAGTAEHVGPSSTSTTSTPSSLGQTDLLLTKAAAPAAVLPAASELERTSEVPAARSSQALRSQQTTRGLLTRLPNRLLLQAGVIIVVVALLLLKLG